MTAQAESVILEASGIAKHFDGLKALTDVNLKVFRGECLAIIGPNGAGKTTFFNILTGLLRQTAGRILFEGADITDLCAAQKGRDWHLPDDANNQRLSSSVRARQRPDRDPGAARSMEGAAPRVLADG